MNWVAVIDHLPALPEVVLLVGACALMIADLHLGGEKRTGTFVMAQVVLALCAMATLFVLWGAGGKKFYIFNGLFVADLMSHVLKLVSYAAMSVTLMYSRQYMLDRGLLRGEFMTLLLFSLLGMMVMI